MMNGEDRAKPAYKRAHEVMRSAEIERLKASANDPSLQCLHDAAFRSAGEPIPSFS